MDDRYPSLRVAYIDEVEETSSDGSKKKGNVYYSSLVKAALVTAGDSTEPVQNLDQVITSLIKKKDSVKFYNINLNYQVHNWIYCPLNKFLNVKFYNNFVIM